MTMPLAAKPFSAARVAARPTQQRGLRLAVAASSQKLSPVQTAVSSLRWETQLPDQEGMPIQRTTPPWGTNE